LNRYYEIFKEYKKLVDGKIQGKKSYENEFIEFLTEENVSAERLFEICARIYEEDPTYLSGIDYLIASSEYSQFVQLMLEYKVRNPDTLFYILINLRSLR
jgi:hypothetical protein